MTRRLAVVLGLAVALLVVLGSCSVIGYTVKQTNLSNQRTAAVKFLKDYPNPDVETIRFTHEGGNPGWGASWRASAVVTVAGRDYNEILGTHISGGNPLPDIVSETTPGSATVIYSDGSSEVLK